MSSRILIVAAALVALLAVPLWLAHDSAIRVRVAEVTRGSLVIRVATNGSIEPIDDHEVRARLDGRVIEIRKAGDVVAAGDVLLRLDRAPVEAQLKSARSQQLEAQEALRSARDTLVRIERTFGTDKKLHGERALANESFVESQAARDEARARVVHLESEVPLRVESLELEIRELEDQLAGTEVLAPEAGSVYRVAAEVGEVVRKGQLLLAAANLGRLQLRANIDQVDLGRVRVGNPVEIFANAFPDAVWRGTITEILPRVEMRQNRAVSEAVAAVDPPVEGLVPGMNVDVEVIVRTAPDVLQVPSEAIFAAGEGPFIYRLNGDRVEMQPVESGLSSFTAVEIVRGAAAGEEVVLGPVAAVRDGSRVDPLRKADGNE